MNSYRQYPRLLSGHPASWDYFTAPGGRQKGMIHDISQGGLLLCTQIEIEPRRWLRIVLQDPSTGMVCLKRGRVVRTEEFWQNWIDDAPTFYQHGIEFLEPLPVKWMETLANSACDVCPCGSLAKRSASGAVCGLCSFRTAVLTSLP